MFWKTLKSYKKTHFSWGIWEKECHPCACHHEWLCILANSGSARCLLIFPSHSLLIVPFPCPAISRASLFSFFFVCVPLLSLLILEFSSMIIQPCFFSSSVPHSSHCSSLVRLHFTAVFFLIDRSYTSFFSRASFLVLFLLLISHLRQLIVHATCPRSFYFLNPPAV